MYVYMDALVHVCGMCVCLSHPHSLLVSILFDLPYTHMRCVVCLFRLRTAHPPPSLLSLSLSLSVFSFPLYYR